MIIPADQLPRTASEIYSQLVADLSSSRHPDTAVRIIAATDILVRDLAHLLIAHGIDHADLPLRYSGNRIIGPGRRLRSIHLRWAALDLLEVNPDLGGKLTRLCKNAAILSGSIQAVAIVADAVDENEKQTLADQFAELRDWSPNSKEHTCA